MFTIALVLFVLMILSMPLLLAGLVVFGFNEHKRQEELREALGLEKKKPFEKVKKELFIEW